MAAFDWIKLLPLKNTLHCVMVSSSPNSPPLFAIAFWSETNRSSLSQTFFKIGVLKNFANFIGKHQCKSIFLIKLLVWTPGTLWKRDSNRGVFLWNLQFLRTPFFAEHLRWPLLNKPRRYLCFIVWRGDALIISASLFYLSNIMLNMLAKSHFTFNLYCELWIRNTQKWLV